MKANSLVFGKILGYIYYGDDFREAVVKNNHLSGIKGNGDIFQYVNWNTPIIRLNTKKVVTGVYAGHGAWNDGVRDIYNTLTGGSASDYESYIRSIGKDSIIKITNAVGISLPNYSFESSQTSQDYRGRLNGQYVVIGKKK